jgi:hypothetical protein
MSASDQILGLLLLVDVVVDEEELCGTPVDATTPRW